MKAPAAVAVLNEIDPARAISTIRVVVPGEEIAEAVEGQFLWVAQSGREHLQIGSITFTPEDGIDEDDLSWSGSGFGRVQDLR